MNYAVLHSNKSLFHQMCSTWQLSFRKYINEQINLHRVDLEEIHVSWVEKGDYVLVCGHSCL